MIDAPSPLGGTGGRYYRPRCAVRIDVPVEGTVGSSTSGLGGLYVPAGQTTASHQDAEDAADGPGFDDTATTSGNVVSILCNARHVDHSRNPWTEADTMTAIIDWRILGVDPRVLTSAVVTLYMGQADVTGAWEPTDDQIRFVGIMKRSKRVGGEDQPLAVEILAHDYTTLFLEAKKFPKDGMPLFTDTVSEAWGRICDHTGYINPANPSEILPSVKALRDRVVAETPDGRVPLAGSALDVIIGSAFTGRMRAAGGRISTDYKSDAWAVWIKTIGMVGLIAYIDKDVCVVTTATDYYTAQNPPVFVWGDNIAEIVEDRDTTLCGKGLHLQSFDPMTGTQIESFYPPLNDSTAHRARVGAKKAGTQAKADTSIDYEDQAYPGVSDQAALDRVCRENYVVMAHQELSGRLTTHEMVVGTASVGATFDLLNLAAGDAIELRIDEGVYASLGKVVGDQARISYLVGIGYDVGLAQIVVANIAELGKLSKVYLVHAVATRLETTEDGGTFAVEISFVNKVLASGSSAAAA